MKQVSNSLFNLLACMSLAVFFTTTACYQQAENMQENPANTMRDGNGAQRDTGEGTAALPSDVPDLNSGSMVSRATNDITRGRTWSLRYDGLELYDLDKYGVKLRANGFKVNVMKGIKGGMATGEKEHEMVTLTVSGQIGLLTVTLRNE